MAYEYQPNLEEDSGESGDGSGSRIEFSDFIGTGEKASSALSSGEKENLLLTHAEVHKDLVIKQKDLRAERKAIKERQAAPVDPHQRMGMGEAREFLFKENPLLKDKAQFSGSRDKQVSELPNENVSDKSKKLHDELQHRLRLGQRMAPGTPRLERR